MSFEDYFSPLPEDLGNLGGLTKEMWDFCDWDTTPMELREPEEGSLKKYCDAHGIKPSDAMRWRQTDEYKNARRTLSLEKGEYDHKIRVILDGWYERARNGDVAAGREYMKFNKDHAETSMKGEGLVNPDDLDDDGESSDEEPPKSAQEMSIEDLEKLLAE